MVKGPGKQANKELLADVTDVKAMCRPPLPQDISPIYPTPGTSSDLGTVVFENEARDPLPAHFRNSKVYRA
ncbi:uncharacterized protein PG986_004516 [Apiospora aurea]|uniref:Uncharacterized protein n=1 Tax=Apiospora aurea TaxID=335848 RepID=A0ABR1QMV5_9PEZI